jgi:predicted site-specific integrase-resolvase
MSIRINGKKYYHTAEACKSAGITKNTFFRWVAKGIFPDVTLRDRRGWRLFSDKELVQLKSEVNRVDVIRSKDK